MAFNVPGNPANYTIGGVRFKFTESGGSELDFGNIVTGSFSSDITFLDHFSAKSGTRLKDRSLVQEISIVINLTSDEPTEEMLNLFMLGGAVASHVFAPYTKTERTGSGKLYGVSDTGNEFTWEIWKCVVKPDGDFTYSDQDWSQFSFQVDVLDDSSTVGHETSPFGQVTHAGTGTNLTP